ncbi:MAG: hypothetical protein LUD19_06075, partial [Clostridia bacterium]|nr:hypothetical protein [Clostridia bacterium]
QAQEVADEIVSLLSGLQDASQEADLTNAEYTVETYYGSTGLGKDTGAKLVSSFSDPTSDDELIQYTITTSTTDDTDVDKVTQAGYNITVRVYYKRISNGASYTCAEVNAFAAAVIAS